MDIPDGRYLCEATYFDVTQADPAMQWVWHGRRDVTFPNAQTQTFDIELEPPPEQRRLIVVEGTYVLKDQHDIGHDDIGHFAFSRTEIVSRDDTHAEFGENNAEGEVGFRLAIKLDWQPTFSVRAEITATMDADNEVQSDSTAFTVKKNDHTPWHWFKADGTSIGNFDDNTITLDLTVHNYQAP